MVEYSTALDAVFSSLADPTRRDMLKRLTRRPLTVSAIAGPYAGSMSLAAVSKHLGVLERAHLIRKRRRGREQVVELSPAALKRVDRYLERYREFWEEHLDRLDAYLKNN